MSSIDANASASNKRQRVASPSEFNQAPSIASCEAPAFASDQANVSDQVPSIAASSQANASSTSSSQATHYNVLALAEILKLNEELRQAKAREDALKAEIEALMSFWTENEALKAKNERLEDELRDSEDHCQELDIGWQDLDTERRIESMHQGSSKAQTKQAAANTTLSEENGKLRATSDRFNNWKKNFLAGIDKSSKQIAELKKMSEDYKNMFKS